jgi:hypothetical protein
MIKIETIQRLVDEARKELALHERSRLQALDKMSKGLDRALKSTDFRCDNQSPDQFVSVLFKGCFSTLLIRNLFKIKIDRLINVQADLAATVSQLDDAYLHNLSFNDEKMKFVKMKRKQSTALSSATSELAVKFSFFKYNLKITESIDCVLEACNSN